MLHNIEKILLLIYCSFLDRARELQMFKQRRSKLLPFRKVIVNQENKKLPDFFNYVMCFILCYKRNRSWFDMLHAFMDLELFTWEVEKALYTFRACIYNSFENAKP